MKINIIIFMFITSSILASYDINIVVHNNNDVENITIEQKRSSEIKEIKKNAGEEYSAVLNINDGVYVLSTNFKKSSTSSEILHLKIDSLNNLLENINIDIYHYQYNDKTNHETIEKIDNFQPSSYHEKLEKYFQSCSFYNAVSDKFPQHIITYRSARICLDSIYKLAIIKNSFFQFNNQFLEKIKDAEISALQEEKSSKRFKKHIDTNYVSNLEDEIYAMKYLFVNRIEKLINDKNLSEAKKLNDIAIEYLKNESQEKSEMIKEKQKIDLTFLENNRQTIIAREYSFTSEISILVKDNNYTEAKKLNDKAMKKLQNESKINQAIVTKKQGITLELLENNKAYINTLLSQF